MSNNIISIKTNFPEVARALDKLSDDIGNRAMVRAMNATIKAGRSDMAKGISKEFRVTQAQAKDRLDVDYARVKGGFKFYASLSATRPRGLFGDDYRGMNMIHFVVGGQPRRTKKGVVRQLNFQIKRTGGRKQIKGAFIATNPKTGGKAVFVRAGKARYPIETKTTIDIPQMFNTKRINSVVRQVMLTRFQTNFDRELRVVLQGWVK